MDESAESMRDMLTRTGKPICECSLVENAIGNQQRSSLWPTTTIPVINRLVTVAVIPSPCESVVVLVLVIAELKSRDAAPPTAIPDIEIEVLVGEQTAKPCLFLTDVLVFA
jgi:hypothetical protein